jgi:hypothetical protein
MDTRQNLTLHPECRMAGHSESPLQREAQRQKYVERRIVLVSADRGLALQVAQSIGVSRPTVWRW